MEVRDQAISRFGHTMELNPALGGVLADDKDPITTLREMGFKGAVITIEAKSA